MISPEEREQRRLEHREARYQLLGMMLSRGREPADIPATLDSTHPDYWRCVAKCRFSHIEALFAENLRLRRQLWSVTGVAVALIVAVVCLSSALWSAYHAS